MRLDNTKYPVVDTLPNNAEAVSIYARDNNTSVGYIYIKYERFINNKGSNPGYLIRCFKGSNYIIPE